MQFTKPPAAPPLSRRDLLKGAVALAALPPGADVLKFEPPAPPEPPEPELTVVCQAENPSGWMTAITRVWAPGVTYCGRCPRERCTLDMGVCLVMVQERVALEDAPDFSAHGRPWLDAPAGPCDGGPPR